MRDIFLIGAGAIGAGAALIHGHLTQRVLVKQACDPAVFAAQPLRRLTAILLQFSTFNWFAGGIALILAAEMGIEARRAISLFVGINYGFAVIGNAWATGGRHIGWVVYAISLILIILSWR